MADYNAFWEHEFEYELKLDHVSAGPSSSSSPSSACEQKAL